MTGVVDTGLPLDFNVRAIESVTLDGPPELAARDLMSPYVWREPDGRYGIMVRAVVPPGAPLTDTGVIWAGWSDDGVRFTMADTPSIVPGPDEHDAGGVEDPTVVRRDDGYVVYYSGVLADHAHGELSYATGPSLDRLVKSGVALASSKSEGNTKEATIDRTPDGRWRLFYEYAADEASRVGMAVGADVAGPWEEQPTPFLPRADSWDDWHLSTGPLLTDDPACPVMFYNGATRDARWRIGWVAFDADYSRVVARGLQPLVTPPPVDDRSATDIAFAASVVVADGAIWLYYSLEDRRLARALIRRS
ncbi:MULTISPECIES: glycosidase [unclassified Sphingomonas]|uniref:glycoside hydrolase family 130 protein n=1 Tax=unclassified Sphingomonas TaxID=196159 RepID=UPI0009E8AC15|nr:MULTISPECIES: glycosidase [unclassified Sphingomonas]